MVKLLFLAAVIAFGCRLVTGRWPWEYLTSKPSRGQAVLRARKLLALPNEASRGEIVEAHKRLLAQVHPDRGGSSAQVHEANAARDLLLNDLPGGN